MHQDPLSPEQRRIVEEAKKILARRHRRGSSLTSPQLTRDYLRLHLNELDHEVFGILHLDNQHQILADEVLFRGTIDGSAVYPREVIHECLKKGSAAIVIYHNHPSGVAEPSQSDRRITEQLIDKLQAIDVRVLDHLVVGNPGIVSFAERGWI
jgi:DNA repair protein RadC